MSDAFPDEDYAKELAEEHVDWFLSAIRPLLIDHFVHGMKHGVKLGKTKQKASSFDSLPK